MTVSKNTRGLPMPRTDIVSSVSPTTARATNPTACRSLFTSKQTALDATAATLPRLKARPIFWCAGQSPTRSSHAAANRIDVRLAALPAGLSVEIADDCRGFEPSGFAGSGRRRPGCG